MTALPTSTSVLHDLRDRSAALDLDGYAAPERKSFLFFRANYYHLFGPTREQTLRAAFRRYWLAKHRARHDFGPGLDELLSTQEVTGDRSGLALAGRRPVIFSGFHYGPYNLIGLVLGALDIQFSILANGAVYMDDFRKRGASHTGPKAVLDETDVIKPGSLSTMLAILDKVRSGKNLLVFGDGLEGQTDYFDRSKLECIDFLDRRLYARRGVATIAYKLNTPVVPFIMSRPEERLRTEFFSPLDPADYPDRAAFVRAYCQSGYGHLAPYVADDPTEWEIFDHLQMYLPGDGLPPAPPTGAPPPADHLRFDAQRFGIFDWRGSLRLLDRNDRSVLGISPRMAELFERLRTPYPVHQVANVVPETLLHEFRLRGILIPSTY